MKKWKKAIGGAAVFGACMMSGMMAAWAGEDLELNTETLRRVIDEPDFSAMAENGEIFSGMGEDGCTIRELEECMQKYQPGLKAFLDMNCISFNLGKMGVSVYLMNDLYSLYGINDELELAEGEWEQKCYDARVYPDGWPWPEEKCELYYWQDEEWYNNRPTDEEMRAELVATIEHIESVNQKNQGASAGGWVSDASGWWYDNGDGTWPADTWKWIDGDHDGVAECYYFGSDGYVLTNQMTPDGYQVNEDGAWVADGVVCKQ